jgi:hypothetical protein
MVAAGTGIPETILFGNAEAGNLATAKSLDRPTELQMRNRQEHWREVFEDILGYVIRKSVEASNGGIQRATLELDRLSGTLVVELPKDSEGNERSAHVDVEFPSILDRDVLERVQAVVAAATLTGSTPAGTMTAETLTRLLLTALDVDDIDEEVERMREQAEEQKKEQEEREQAAEDDDEDEDEREEDDEDRVAEAQNNLIAELRKFREAVARSGVA